MDERGETGAITPQYIQRAHSLIRNAPSYPLKGPKPKYDHHNHPLPHIACVDVCFSVLQADVPPLTVTGPLPCCFCTVSIFGPNPIKHRQHTPNTTQRTPYSIHLCSSTQPHNHHRTQSATMSKSLKIVVVGDGYCGKTSLLMQYATDAFPQDYTPTVFDNFAKTIMFEGTPYALGLWDTAGQHEYVCLLPPSCPV